jgi:hypothetical protein
MVWGILGKWWYLNMGSSEMDKQAKEKEPKTPPAAAAATTTTQVCLSSSELVIDERVVSLAYGWLLIFYSFIVMFFFSGAVFDYWPWCCS